MLTEYSPTQIHAKKKLKIELNFKLEALGSTEKKITKDKNSENKAHLENTEVVLFHYNIANCDYQKDSGVLYAFVPINSFYHLLEISQIFFIFLKSFNSDFFILKYGLLLKILNH